MLYKITFYLVNGTKNKHRSCSSDNNISKFIFKKEAYFRHLYFMMRKHINVYIFSVTYLQGQRSTTCQCEILYIVLTTEYPQ